MLSTYFQGFSLSAGLIIAIGSQNAFILRQGLKKEHTFAICTICFLCDAALIIFGVAGFGTLVATSESLLLAARWGGALFLFAYGARAFYAASRSATLEVDAPGRQTCSLRSAVATTLALTLLNPHVYIDTIILIGSIAGQFPAHERLTFTLGATSASLVWFYTLGYGARVLTPLFRKQLSWKILDLLIGVVMWAIALNLLLPALSSA